ncbi:Hypothetical protein NTJ_03233 [Nesidiocoris tenuis]|uniref:Uncharacterized protein n=1 Tax=Nesidiocoris tenuis TaxID=355587 RepID=A0ABN7AGD1_9HEMI|nr:Hypothetical protein NTJ_03233 [Nesidiocoris tenuis]
MGEGGANTTTVSSSDGADTTTEPAEPSREQIRMEFYKTYDVMTGVRIACTLGGFFSLMVLLVVYKSKCKSRSISEENLEATVAAAVAEDEQAIGFAFRKGYSLYGGSKAYAASANANFTGFTRFSSVGGGYNIYAPPTRRYQWTGAEAAPGWAYPPPRGRVSLPTSSPYIYPSPPSPYLPRTLLMNSPPPTRFNQEDYDEYDGDALRRGPTLLCVPSSRRSSRRLSSITCSSCDTSYLERRGSSMEMGRPIGPPFHGGPGSDRLLEEEPWDFYYPIDIQVIQPTPDISPAESQLSVFKCENREPTTLCVPRMAPLASISSCRMPTNADRQDSHSIGSDSVFLDEELIDTEDEVDEFSTDSDADNLECNIPSKQTRNDPTFNTSSCSFKQQQNTSNVEKQPQRQQKPAVVNRVPSRRNSSPMPSRVSLSICQTGSVPDGREEKKPSSTSTSSLISTLKSTLRTSSDSDTIHVSKGVEILANRSFKSISRTSMSASCDHLVKVLQEHTLQSSSTATKTVEHCSWSQETLF